MDKIRVLLADDHTVVRQGLRVLLEAEADLAVVGEAETGRQAVQLARKLAPDVIVMDIAMPNLNGLEATRQITREASGRGKRCFLLPVVVKRCHSLIGCDQPRTGNLRL